MVLISSLFVLHASAQADKLTAQAAATLTRLQVGEDLSTLMQSRVHSMVVQDVLGRPFYHLVYLTLQTSIRTHAQGWPLLLKSEEVSCKPGYAQACSAALVWVGAREDVEMQSTLRLGNKMLINLNEIVQRVGEGSLKRIFSYAPGSLALETNRGQIFDVETLKELTLSEQLRLRANFQLQNQRIKSAGNYTKDSASKWRQIQNAKTSRRTKQWSLSPEEDLPITPVGDLDLKRLLSANPTRGIQGSLTQKKTTLSKGSSKISESCFWKFCWEVAWEGKLENLDHNYSEIVGGYAQFPWYAALQNRAWEKYENIDLCLLPFNQGPEKTPYYSSSGLPMGCGPSAFMALTDWWWRYKGENFFSLPFNGERLHYTSQDILDSGSPHFEWRQKGSIWLEFLKTTELKHPLLMDEMKTCWYRAGSLTFPDKFITGANIALARSQNSNLKMVGEYNYILGNILPFVNKTGIMAQHLLETIGLRNEPVIALYPTPEAFGGLHYSPIQNFRVVEGVGYTTIWVQTTDHPDQWISLSDPWQLAVGTFALKHLPNKK